MFRYWRFVFAWMGFSGLVLVYMLRVNISVAIVGMVNSTVYKSSNFTPECPVTSVNESQNTESSGEFLWSEDEQALLLSSFYWGYTLMQIPSIILLYYFNWKWVYGLSTLTTSILTFLIPLVAYSGVYWMVFLRFLMGICEGPTYPSLFSLSGRWILRKENSFLMSFIGSGSFVGTVIGQSLTGLIFQQLGWKYVFYIMGIFGCVWFIVYAVVVSDKPMNHPFISEFEKRLLVDSLPHNRSDYKMKQSSFPCKKVALSKPYIGYLILAVSYGYTWYTMVNCFPLYIGKVLGFNISQNGAISSLPYLCLLMFTIIAGASQDWIKSKNVISTTKLRKLYACPAMVLSALLLYSVTFSGCNIHLAIALVCFSVAMLGFCDCVSVVNIIDIAPAHAGYMYAIVNVFNSLCGIVAPFIQNAFTRLGETRENWKNVFITSSSILLVGSFVYLFLGSGSIQPWAIVNNDPELDVEYEPLINEDHNKIESDELILKTSKYSMT